MCTFAVFYCLEKAVLYMIKNITPQNFIKTNGGVFEGFGTSLCWWAHRVGYSEKLCKKAGKLFFSEEGLNLNIMRYNIGGGDDPSHNHIERTDSAVPGYLEYDKNSGKAIWNFEADKNQLAVLKSAYENAGEDSYVEVFSNSPPYFMTNSGCSSGSANAVDNNLRDDCIEAFAKYLADVSSYIEKELHIKIKSVSPMNEPDTDYWKMFSPKQEGCHTDPGEKQSELLCATRKAFDEAGLSHVILAASDETSTERQINSYKMYSDEAKKAVGRISTHSYITDKIEELGALREKEGFNLWMSEVDGAGTEGESAGEMSAALWLSKKIISDINALGPSAWVLWLVMDYHKSKDGYNGKTDNWNYDKEKGFWGLGHCDHDEEEYVLTQKYYAFGQFTRYIRPGMTLIRVDENTLGAYDKNTGRLSVVYVNCKNENENITFDLAAFSKVGESCETVVTSGSVENGKHWYNENGILCVNDKKIKAFAEPNSVTTFILDGVEL